MSNSSQAPRQLKKLTDKRLALESLIKITVSIQAQQQSLIELSAIARPSQEFPPKLIAHVKQLGSRIGDLPVPELIQRLDAIEQVISTGLKKLLILAKIDVKDLRSKKLANLSIDDFVDAIDDFKRRTQTALALRFILKDRGVAIAPFDLAVPQEAITAHIEALKVKEKGCTKQIRKEITDVIKDTDLLLASDSFTEPMKSDLLQVRKAMQVNIEHLDSGGTIAEIPNIFETVVLESQVYDVNPINKPEEEDSNQKASKDKTRNEELESDLKAQAKSDVKAKLNAAKKKISSNKPKETKPMTFWQRFGLWLSSPWSVSWKSIDKDSNK